MGASTTCTESAAVLTVFAHVSTPHPSCTAIAYIPAIFRYDSIVIRNGTIVAYLGWMAFSFTTSGSHRPSAATASSLVNRRTRMVYSLGSLVLIALWMLFYMERAPLTYYCYALFPCFFWSDVFAHISVKGMRQVIERMTEHVFSIPLYQCALVGLALASIVVSYSCLS